MKHAAGGTTRDPQPNRCPSGQARQDLTVTLGASRNAQPDWHGPQILELLRKIVGLRALYLRGNPAVSAIKSYRKATIAALPHLTYLDDRPVTERERRCAEAWCKTLALGLFEQRLYT